MDSRTSERESSSPSPLELHSPNSSLSPEGKDFRDNEKVDEEEERTTSTSAGQSPAPVTNTRPQFRSRKKPMSDESKAMQLREMITKTQLQIDDTRRRVHENCERLNENRANGPTPKNSSAIRSTSFPAVPTVDANGDTCQRDVIEQARHVVKHNIEQLTKYNELKDVSMALLGMIAEAEGKRLREVMNERDIRSDLSRS